MKKALLAAPLVAVLLLTGCAGRDDKKALDNCHQAVMGVFDQKVPDATDADRASFAAKVTKQCAAEQRKDPDAFYKTYGG